MKSEAIKVLLIEDDEDDYILTRELLSEVKGGKYALDWAPSYEEGLEVAGRGEHHVCLVDYRLGERSGVQLIREARESRLTIPMILLTGQGNHDIDVEAMQAGATDYMVKDDTPSALLERTIRYAIELHTERRRAEEVLEAYAQKQAVVAEIGRVALTGGELNDLFAQAVPLVAATLAVEYCKVTELLPDRSALILRAAVGWKEACPIGQAISASQEFQTGFTLLSNEPVVVEDFRTETRFSGPPLLHEHGVVSGMSVVIRGNKGPYGVLSAHSNYGRRFGTDDVNFMVAVANVLAEAIGRKRADDQDVAHVLGLNAEITERKRTEEALIQSERRFRDLFENASDVIYTADSKGNFTSLNRSGERMTGYTREEALHLNVSQVVSPESLKLAQEMTDRKLKSDDETVYELEVFKKGGERLLVEVSSRLIYKNGKPVGIQGIGRDITQRKQVEAELEQARDAALESARLKSEFLANMSHEIRTPMNGVIGMTGLLLETDLSSRQRKYTDTIQFSADALLRIIDDILDFSKIEAGLLRFEKIDFELSGAVEGAVELLAERAQAKGLELALLVNSGVPTALQGDPGRLRQVLTNLIGNAVKFTDRGKVLVSVTKVNETASDATLRFEIQDTGIGISTEAQRGLFRAFTQADGSTTRKYGGTGLGLAISKELVALMEGEIGIESAPDHGSTFWFTGRFEKQLTPATARESAGHLSGARLLIVDDNTANRNILKQQTSSWDMIVSEAESGARALELLRAGVAQGEPYDILVLDLIGPDMNGFQLAEAIKSDPTIASVALVLLPSFTKRGHGQRASQAGIAAYLPKPVRQSQLYDCVTTLMARSGRNPVTALELVTRYSLRESEVQQEDKAFSNVRILVAEDNLVNQDVALGQLYNLGYLAEAVPNGRELLKALENNHVDIILMDCQMPEIDGFAATAEIRRREGTARHTTIIAMTANALNGDPERCLAAGMDDYLSKPVKSELLRLKLERWTRPGKELSAAGLNEGTVPAEVAGVSPIDLSQLAALRLIRQPGRPNLFTELIDLFLDEATSDLKALHQALMMGDAVEIQRGAHRLKGGSANIGATQLAALSEELENKDPAKDATDLMAQLENEFERVREALKAERKETEE